MPFFDDSGVRTEEHRGPLLSAFAVLFDQVERMVVLNVAWAVQQVPLVAALAFPELPLGVRVLCVAYSVLALAPATGALFGMVARACDGELLRLETAREVLGEVARFSLVTLMPLYSLFVWLALLAGWAARQELVVLDVLARLAILLLAVCAVYWGPLLAARPQQSALAVLRESVRLAWRFPLLTVMAGLASLLAAALGLLSVGGMVLVVPVLVALVQTQQYRHVKRET